MEQPLNLKSQLHITQLMDNRGGLGFITFPLLVAKHIGPPTDLREGHFEFFGLPGELRLQVYGFCDLATLFWLMKTCSSIRKDTEPLFWSHPDHWYHVSLELLLPSCASSLRYFCPDFAANVQQVEVVGTELNDISFHQFLENFRNCFPRARKVIINTRSDEEDFLATKTPRLNPCRTNNPSIFEEEVEDEVTPPDDLEVYFLSYPYTDDRLEEWGKSFRHDRRDRRDRLRVRMPCTRSNDLTGRFHRLGYLADEMRLLERGVCRIRRQLFREQYDACSIVGQIDCSTCYQLTHSFLPSPPWAHHTFQEGSCAGCDVDGFPTVFSLPRCHPGSLAGAEQLEHIMHFISQKRKNVVDQHIKLFRDLSLNDSYRPFKDVIVNWSFQTQPGMLYSRDGLQQDLQNFPRELPKKILNLPWEYPRFLGIKQCLEEFNRAMPCASQEKSDAVCRDILLQSWTDLFWLNCYLPALSPAMKGAFIYTSEIGLYHL